ncbi:MAG TPA: hypothetical protein VJC20_01675 [Candidatus Paceibacterota bacterium]
MWRYWTIGIGGAVIALLQQLGFPASFKRFVASAGGIGLAALGFWLLAEEQEKTRKEKTRSNDDPNV